MKLSLALAAVFAAGAACASLLLWIAEAEQGLVEVRAPVEDTLSCHDAATSDGRSIDVLKLASIEMEVEALQAVTDRMQLQGRLSAFGERAVLEIAERCSCSTIQQSMDGMAISPELLRAFQELPCETRDCIEEQFASFVERVELDCYAE